MKKLHLLLILIGVQMLSSCSQHYAGITKVKAGQHSQATKKSNRISNTENIEKDLVFMETEPTISSNSPVMDVETFTTTSTNKSNKVTFKQNQTPATKYDMSHIKGRKAKVEKQQANLANKTEAGHNQVVAGLLSFFLGILGIHRFYLGYTGIGILMLLTGGVFGILALIDFIRILFGDLKPKDGDYIK